MTKILISAGETSTDLYGARLVSALKQKLTPPLNITGLGGPRMRQAGMTVNIDLIKEAGTGLDHLTRLGIFARALRQMVSYARRARPDVAVLMDLPDFNLRLAKELKRLHIPVVYYISPQVWAWRPGRLKTISQLVDKMLVIFEFEKALYEKYNIPVAFVGHPLLDIIGDLPDGQAGIRNLSRRGGTIRNKLGLPKEALVIGFLPGSRRNEFVRHFPIMLKTARLVRNKLPETMFILGCAPQISGNIIKKCLTRADIKIQPYFNQTYEVMQASDLVVTASGTATIEAAIFGTPMIVVYKVSLITASLLGPLVKIPHYAMVNIVAGRELVPELIQSEMTPENISEEIMRLLKDNHLKTMSEEISEIRKKLGSTGASQRAAEEITKVLSKPSET